MARAQLIHIGVETVKKKKSAMLILLPVGLFSKQKSTQNINGKNYWETWWNALSLTTVEIITLYNTT